MNVETFVNDKSIILEKFTYFHKFTLTVILAIGVFISHKDLSINIQPTRLIVYGIAMSVLWNIKYSVMINFVSCNITKAFSILWINRKYTYKVNNNSEIIFKRSMFNEFYGMGYERYSMTLKQNSNEIYLTGIFKKELNKYVSIFEANNIKTNARRIGTSA